ncbi:MAG: hypothetical protein WBB07_29380 [Mycobacterium sp.]
MGGEPGVSARLAARVRRWFTGLGFSQMRQLAVLLVLAVTAFFGGLDSANTKVTVFEPGDEFGDGQYTLSVDRASMLDKITAGTRVVLPDNPDRRYLAVVANLTNDGHVPGNLSKVFDLVGQPEKRFVGAYRIADSTSNWWLGPGLSDTFAFIWELPDADLTPGEAVTLRVWKKKFTELSVTYGQSWIDSVTEYGEITVPVRERS